MTREQAEGRRGPLAGLRVIEMAGIGPVPMAGLMLAEMGATVLRIARHNAPPSFLPMDDIVDFSLLGRRRVGIDLKSSDGVELALRLIARSDILIEGFRPGVMERLGLGPDVALTRHPGLVYGRMTGFGQDGPLAPRAGHDLNYIAMSGILHAIGHAGGRPVPPINLVGDYGGGTMFLLTGILAALIERGRSGKGQVVDAAMVDGAATLGLSVYSLLAAGLWADRRGENILDSGCPFYDTYETADGRHVAVACLEPQFFAEFSRLLPLDASFVARQYDRACWPAMRSEIATRLREGGRDEWEAHFSGSDACVTPVLSLTEATKHPHAQARAAYSDDGNFLRPAPAPRFSRSQGTASGLDTAPLDETLAEFGISQQEAAELAKAGLVTQ